MPQSLCDTCKNMREVNTTRSRFLLCELSVTNASYPKYPRQPVMWCGGYQQRALASEHPHDRLPETRQ
jgi:hypothetical protein